MSTALVANKNGAKKSGTILLAPYVSSCAKKARRWLWIPMPTAGSLLPALRLNWGDLVLHFRPRGHIQLLWPLLLVEGHVCTRHASALDAVKCDGHDSSGWGVDVGTADAGRICSSAHTSESDAIRRRRSNQLPDGCRS